MSKSSIGIAFLIGVGVGFTMAASAYMDRQPQRMIYSSTNTHTNIVSLDEMRKRRDER